MRNILINLLLVCACINTYAQTNFVKNPEFEEYAKCPDNSNQIILANYWTCAVDTIGEPLYAPEYFNTCNSTSPLLGLPSNSYFFQKPHSGNAFVGAQLYYDKTLPAPPSGLPFNTRDYLQGRLRGMLLAGKIYCVSFWVNLAEGSGYAQNHLGAYVDNGGINGSLDPAGTELTSVIPQVFSLTTILDTAKWTKIEGTFIANGDETHITLGNFFTNSMITVVVTNYWFSTPQYSYYLIDDVSVIPIDLAADAGKDSHAELGKKVQIGRVGDTTAQGLDCKWYKKGLLIDSGAIISVNAGATVGAIDTYVVVQTICGLVKTDTVTVKTVPVGIPLPGEPVPSSRELRGGFSVYPNPSNGSLTITPHAVIPTQAQLASVAQGSLHAKVYDLLGRVVYQKELSFTDNQASVDLSVADGIYILEFIDAEGNASRQRIEIRN